MRTMLLLFLLLHLCLAGTIDNKVDANVNKAIDGNLEANGEAHLDDSQGHDSGISQVEILNKRIEEFDENIVAIGELKTVMQTIEDELKTLSITQEMREEKFLFDENDKKSSEERRLLGVMDEATNYLEDCKKDSCESKKIQELKAKAIATFSEIKNTGRISEQFKTSFDIKKLEFDEAAALAEKTQMAKKADAIKAEEAKGTIEDPDSVEQDHQANKENSVQLYIEDCSSCKFVLNWGNILYIFPGCSSCKLVFAWGSSHHLKLPMGELYDLAYNTVLQLSVSMVRELVQWTGRWTGWIDGHVDGEIPGVGNILVQAYTWLADQVSSLDEAKGQPFPRIIGPAPHERVCVVGAGPAGLHMALSLKKRGYNKVAIFEKTDRVGGKSLDVEHKGHSQPMSTLYILPDYFDTFVPLAKDYGRGDLRRFPKPQVWKTNDAAEPSNKLSNEEFVLGSIEKITNVAGSLQNGAAYVRDIARYISIHREMFGKYQGELMLKPGPAILRRIRGTFLEFLEREKLKTLVPILTVLVTMPGYGYLDEISALYGLMWITPRLMSSGVVSSGEHLEPSKGMYFLKDGFQEIWKGIANKENLDVRFNSNLVKVVRTPSHVYLHLSESEGTRSIVETCDFLIWAAPMTELLNVAEPSTANENKLFGSQTSIPYSSSLVNLTNVARHSPAVLYQENIDKKEEHGPVTLVDFQGLLDPHILSKEGKADYDAKTDQVTTATVVQMGKEEISTSLLNEKLVKHYKEGFGVTEVEFIETKTWSYFPRWSPAETGEGRHWQVFEIQGQQRTWYAGASVSFESVKSVLEYNNLLLRQMNVTQLGPTLKTTYSTKPKKHFLAAQPRTRQEAINQGYSKMSPDWSCEEKFLGYAYADPTEPSIAILFDAAGYMAGVQSIILKSEIDESLFSHAAYQPGVFFGQECLVTTAYFVDPEMICDRGRSEQEWSNWRKLFTGDRLWVQVGETPKNFAKVPLSKSEADGTSNWKEHLCFPGMGTHYMEFDYSPDQLCGEVFPVQIMYDQGVIMGFVWQHSAHLPGKRWEHPDKNEVNRVIDSAPDCILNRVDTPGLSTLHHYFVAQPHQVRCPCPILDMLKASGLSTLHQFFNDHLWFK